MPVAVIRFNVSKITWYQAHAPSLSSGIRRRDVLDFSVRNVTIFFFCCVGDNPLFVAFAVCSLRLRIPTSSASRSLTCLEIPCPFFLLEHSLQPPLVLYRGSHGVYKCPLRATRVTSMPTSVIGLFVCSGVVSVNKNKRTGDLLK